MKALLLFAGVLIGVISTLVIITNTDLLSVKKGGVVTLKHDLNFIENDNIKLTLPKGTNLNFASQYDDVAEYCLGVVITDLSSVIDTDGVSMYFSEQTENEK